MGGGYENYGMGHECESGEEGVMRETRGGVDIVNGC